MTAGVGAQVDFYLLGSPALDASRLACKLALMAWERGHRVDVVAGADQAEALDRLMWDFPAGRFLPHARAGADDAAEAPVRIHERAPGSGDVIINLTPEPLSGPPDCARLLEIVPHDPADREASRKKFRAYRGLGLEPATHDIN